MYPAPANSTDRTVLGVVLCSGLVATSDTANPGYFHLIGATAYIGLSGSINNDLQILNLSYLLTYEI